MLDLQAYYQKLVEQTPLSESEVVALLKELEQFRTVATYLASCQAATLESLPNSTSKSSRARHVTICTTAAQALVGDTSGIRYPSTLKVAETRERCLKAVAKHA